MKMFRTARRFQTLALVGLLLGGLGSALSAELTVKLTGDQEVPPVTTSATGTGTIAIKADKSVSGSITTVGIQGTMAHIHLAPSGTNGPPIITLVKTSETVWSVPEGAMLTDDQFKSFKDGNLYVNVHSAAHPGGEIRAQLKP
jgi:CHRD domain